MKIKRLLTGGLVSLCSFFALAAWGNSKDEDSSIEPYAAYGATKLNENEYNELQEQLSKDNDKLKDYKSVTCNIEYKITNKIGEKTFVYTESKAKSIFDFESGNLSYVSNYKWTDPLTNSELLTMDFKLDSFKKDDGYILVFDLVLWNYPIRELLTDENGYQYIAYSEKYAGGTLKGYSYCSLDFNVSISSYLLFKMPFPYNRYLGIEDDGIGVYANKDRSYIYDCCYTETNKSSKSYSIAKNGLLVSHGYEKEVKGIVSEAGAEAIFNQNCSSKYVYIDKTQLDREASTSNLTYIDNIVENLNLKNTMHFLGDIQISGDWTVHNGNNYSLPADFLKDYFIIGDYQY